MSKLFAQSTVHRASCLVFRDGLRYIPYVFIRKAALTNMNLTDLLNDPPKPHEDAQGQVYSMGSDGGSPQIYLWKY